MFHVERAHPPSPWANEDGRGHLSTFEQAAVAGEGPPRGLFHVDRPLAPRRESPSTFEQATIAGSGEASVYSRLT
jgi:hypothetical protein